MNVFRVDFLAAMRCQSIPVLFAHHRIAMEVNSVPLLGMMVPGVSCSVTMRFSARATRSPERDPSAIRAKFSRV